jgi:hypothetical protein
MFATTRWSLVAAARDRSLPEARHALAELCRAYWYPVYAYVRWRQRIREHLPQLAPADPGGVQQFRFLSPQAGLIRHVGGRRAARCGPPPGC